MYTAHLLENNPSYTGKFSPGYPYIAGQLVTYDSIIYRATTDVISEELSGEWEEYELEVKLSDITTHIPPTWAKAVTLDVNGHVFFWEYDPNLQVGWNCGIWENDWITGSKVYAGITLLPAIGVNEWHPLKIILK